MATMNRHFEQNIAPTMSEDAADEVQAKPYMNPYLAGILLGVVLFLAFFITGSGLGASGGLNRLLVVVQDFIAPQHVDNVPYLIDMAGGDKNPLDSWIVFLTIGTVIGGFVSGWRNHRIKVETVKGKNIETYY